MRNRSAYSIGIRRSSGERMKSQTLFLLLAAAMLTGCATQKMSGDQLARIAKDWSLSIRASQVIPVYPLTEDLQPGDVFLVQTPIKRAGEDLSRQGLPAARESCDAVVTPRLRAVLSGLVRVPTLDELALDIDPIQR